MGSVYSCHCQVNSMCKQIHTSSIAMTSESTRYKHLQTAPPASYAIVVVVCFIGKDESLKGHVVRQLASPAIIISTFCCISFLYLARESLLSKLSPYRLFLSAIYKILHIVLCVRSLGFRELMSSLFKFPIYI